ncbi:KH domain-containing protein [Fusobacterium sp. PH5-44]|uniref:KH domain-containing protein n=1 Tax=unclassified Fusobacterium TaxID=2648384 RepID=UPI003D20A0B9
MNIRALEKNNKMGYIFFITYNGRSFDSFDEIAGKKTIKGEFSTILKILNFSWAKGIQQAGRTDKNVSANENILYVSSNFYGDLNKLKNDFNKISKNNLQIKRIIKTLPNLLIPDLIDKREYIYAPNKKYILNSQKTITELVNDLSGTYDMSEFTDTKGKLLKNLIREVNITFDNNSLRFIGNSFLPHQVRIMSSYILSNEKKLYPGKFLTLDKIYLKNELQNILFFPINKDAFENNDLIDQVEKSFDESLYIFYIKTGYKGTFIGKNGKNIKTLRKTLGNILVREI